MIKAKIEHDYPYSRIERFDDARAAKGAAGRAAHGGTAESFSGEPLLELDEELLDAANYIDAAIAAISIVSPEGRRAITDLSAERDRVAALWWRNRDRLRLLGILPAAVPSDRSKLADA